MLDPIKKSGSKVDGVIHAISGGRVDFWTLNNPNAGRSRRYHGVIIDEAAFAEDDLQAIWERAIKPALLDYRGSPGSFLLQAARTTTTGSTASARIRAWASSKCTPRRRRILFCRQTKSPSSSGTTPPRSTARNTLPSSSTGPASRSSPSRPCSSTAPQCRSRGSAIRSSPSSIRPSRAGSITTRRGSYTWHTIRSRTRRRSSSTGISFKSRGLGKRPGFRASIAAGKNSRAWSAPGGATAAR